MTTTMQKKTGKGKVKVHVVNKQVEVAQRAQEDFHSKLDELVTFISGWKNFRVYNGTQDGRLVSLLKEEKITKALLDEYSWVYNKANNRDTADFYIKVSTGHVFPVNVKLIANFNKQYNNMCGTVYTISKLLYNEPSAGREAIAGRLRDKEPFTTYPVQYGFLMVNKTSGEVKACTLFNMTDFVVNPSNGFQFKFDEVNTVNRTQLEGQQFVARKFVELITSQAKPFLALTA
jgi:hypothetical protein